MSGLLAPKAKAPVLPPVPATPSRDNAEAQAAMEATLLAEKRRRGRSATLLTGGMGDTTPAPTVERRLLGA